ncbi:hypothetical protein R1flu_025744 [Riccia fluitans]|uniref:Uncharacterized protein n=1 Tax=Riccia fluitans TaxID=41844 RepID=A0ABD1XYT8_9MARC
MAHTSSVREDPAEIVNAWRYTSTPGESCPAANVDPQAPSCDLSNTPRRSWPPPQSRSDVAAGKYCLPRPIED